MAAISEAASGFWGVTSGFLGEDPLLGSAILLCLGLVLVASLLWIRHWRSEIRRLEAFMDPLSAFEEPA